MEDILNEIKSLLDSESVRKLSVKDYRELLIEISDEIQMRLDASENDKI